jgi:hypothetical protein
MNEPFAILFTHFDYLKSHCFSDDYAFVVIHSGQRVFSINNNHRTPFSIFEDLDEHGF